MKYFWFLILLFIVKPVFSNFDAGKCYFFEFEFTTRSGSVETGYTSLGTYFLSIEEVDNSLVFYCSDYLTGISIHSSPLAVSRRLDFDELELSDTNSLFDNCVFAILPDSLFVGREIGKIYYRDWRNKLQLVPFILNSQFERIAKRDIVGFHINRVISCMVGERVLTNLSGADLKWARIENFLEIRSLGGGYCRYVALIYSPLTEASLVELDKMLESVKSFVLLSSLAATKEVQQIYIRAKEEQVKIIERLRQLHILILEGCSC